MTGKEDTMQGDEAIGRLIAAAGRGPTASSAARDRIYSVVRARWEESLSEKPSDEGNSGASVSGRTDHRRRRVSGSSIGRTRARRAWTMRLGGLAATLAAVAVTLSWLQTGGSDGSAVELASLTLLQGDAELRRGGELLALASADSILADDVLYTGADSRVALELDGGLVLRVDAGTELRFSDRSRIELRTGTVYVDSGRTGSSQPFEIGTALAAVRHVGTQYEVRFADAGLRVRVREGSVEVSGEPVEAVGSAGEQLDIGSGGLVMRSAIAPHDAAWDWATSLAALPELTEYPVGETLDWIARERGLTLAYSNQEIASLLGDSVVLGLAGLDPFEALEVLERTADLRLEIDGTRLLVSI